MNRLRHDRRGAWIGIFWGVVACLACAAAPASEVLLKDGRVLKGKLAETFGLAELANASDPDGGHIKQIIFLDNDLTRTFISKRQIQDVKPDSAGQVEEKFNIRQRTSRSGSKVMSVGPAAKAVGNFDEFGRRTYTMLTAKGPLPVIQAITEITPQWIKVEGVNYTWDMRVATSTIPRETLNKILLKQVDPKNVEQRKKIARFYIQCERYEEARDALEQIVKDFPEQTDIKQQLDPTIRALRQLGAQRLLSELKLRREAGQHQLVQSLLKKFPSEDVSGEILQAVREMIQEYDTLEASRAKVVKQFGILAAQVTEPTTRANCARLHKEISADLSVETLPRMAAFLQNVDDEKMPAEERVALAISGWLLGADGATDKLSTALSADRLCQLALKYLRETVKLHRNHLLDALPSEEGATPELLANLLAHMKAPLELPEPVSEKKPGYYCLEVVGLAKEAPVTYYVQLPPEYNPHRQYPMIVTLHGLASDAEQQVDWWAGEWSERGRMGQATRHGYIVVAPQWTVEHQKEYEFSAREHAAVLNSVRDACRRFAVDTDRVFLTGHSAGGDAAWDMGLAHPDLWAGVIPIAAESQKFCIYYWENAKNLPFYVIEGELDGGKMTKNARDLDRYLRHGFNTTVVEYLGRGHEHFADEQLRLFDWMGRFHRNFFPREFSCATLRPWDNYFWWAEVGGMPPASMINPYNWPPPRNTQAITIKGSMMANNSLYLRTGSTKAIVWLSPQMVDFKNRISLSVNGHRITSVGPIVKPSLETILEDVRTRGDRQHPFWAKVEVNGR